MNRECILVIDDAREVRDLIKAMLEQQGYEVIVAENGAEGLALAKKHNPLVIVADVLMPEMDGFALFKALKADPQTAEVPVIILTARSKMEESFQVVGVDCFLAKPVNAQDLFNEIKRFAEQSRYARKARAARQAEIPPVSPPVSPSPSPVKSPTTFKEMQETMEARTSGGGRKRVVVFGTNAAVLASMTQQLEKENCDVTALTNERHVASTVNEVEPDLILLQLKGDTLIPLDEMVFSLTTLIQEKSQEFGKSLYNPNIVLYKVDEEREGIGSLAEEMADTESLLERCYDSGNAKYIGLYSAISFIMKIKVFLNG